MRFKINGLRFVIFLSCQRLTTTWTCSCLYEAILPALRLWGILRGTPSRPDEGKGCVARPSRWKLVDCVLFCLMPRV